LFGPAMSVFGLCLSYIDVTAGFGRAAAWLTLALASRRFLHRSKHVKANALAWIPKALWIVIAIVGLALIFMVGQLPGGSLDNIPFTALVAFATLSMWGVDMWRYRTYIELRFAKT
jgi:hypothetical protein